MHQEERVNDIEELKAYIVKHQDVVDSTDEKDDGESLLFQTFVTLIAHLVL